MIYYQGFVSNFHFFIFFVSFVVSFLLLLINLLKVTLFVENQLKFTRKISEISSNHLLL